MSGAVLGLTLVAAFVLGTIAGFVWAISIVHRAAREEWRRRR